MSDSVKNVLDQMDPQIVLDALQGQLGTKTKESEAASMKIAKALEKAGVDCGPENIRSGFVQRMLMNYARDNMLRELHQRVAQKAAE